MTETVLIVGAGPVGLAAALELARYKVPVRLVERSPEPALASRAVVVWARTLELLDRAGASADLVARGNKVTAAHIIAGGEALARIALDGMDTPYPFALMLPQRETETVLERHLAAFGIVPERGVELTAFRQDGTGVTASLRHGDGRAESARFSWLVACDGAHSPVRHALGLAFAGDTLDSDWALGDFRPTGLPCPENEIATYWHAEGPIVFLPLGAGRCRFIAGLGSSREATPASPTAAGFQALLDRRGPGGITLGAPEWTSAFRINERQVARYRVGRVFLAGDAAHVHSPAGGQGMNTGMQDAINLAWKLALVCRGMGAASALLDSYDIERRAVGAEVIAASGRLTQVATISNPVGRQLRNAVAHFMLGLPAIRHAVESQMMEISTGYAVSPLNGPAGGAGPRPGTRMPPVAGEEAYGVGDTPRFTLRAPGVAVIPEEIRHRDLLDPRIRPHAAGQGIALVRPDGYLAMTAADGDWALVDAHLDRLAAGTP
ncbi:FAD-dependent monooxygenase [Xanthobacter sp. V0B-10]|uniref:FAD-dependent monooxygenase n=1 Tax=Xanthobacter albus TaxID=3119929 RepID=UPI00372B743B